MSTRHYAATIAIAASIAFTAGPAHAQPPPSPGQACFVEGATTRDAAGRTMWCNPMMTGNHSLVWQLRPAGSP